MDENKVRYLLKKFTEGTLTEQEYVEFTELIQDTEANPAIYEFMDQVWDSLNTSIPFTQLRANMLYQKITNDPRFLAAKPVKPLHIKRNFYWAKVAASILVLGVMAAMAGNYFFKKAEAPVYAVYQAPLGNKLKLNLPDGSTVWLNAGSQLKFPQQFKGTQRHVFLQGEAYFDVAHHKTKPFIIHTGKVNTQVLGTAFNVSAYNKNIVEVTVTRGKVSVNTQNRQLGLLTPNQQLTYNTTSQLTKKREVNAALYTSWTVGELVLNNVDMQQASEIIGRWYNVKFAFKNEDIKKCRFVATFPKNAEINKVMNVISRLNNFKYEIDHNNIYISGKGCNN